MVDWCSTHVAVSHARDGPSGQDACSDDWSRLPKSIHTRFIPSMSWTHRYGALTHTASVPMLCGLLEACNHSGVPALHAWGPERSGEMPGGVLQQGQTCDGRLTALQQQVQPRLWQDSAG